MTEQEAIAMAQSLVPGATWNSASQVNAYLNDGSGNYSLNNGAWQVYGEDQEPVIIIVK